MIAQSRFPDKREAALLISMEVSLAMRSNTSTNVDELIAFGKMALEQGWHDQARDYFEQALTLDASNREAIDGLARANEVLARREAVAVEPMQDKPVKPPREETEKQEKAGAQCMNAALAGLWLVVFLPLLSYLFFRAKGYPAHWRTFVSASDTALGLATWVLIVLIPVWIIGQRTSEAIWPIFLSLRPRGRRAKIETILALVWLGLTALVTYAILMNASYQTLLFGVPFPPGMSDQFVFDPSGVVRISVVYQRFVDFLVTLGIYQALSWLLWILVAVVGGAAVIHIAKKRLTAVEPTKPQAEPIQQASFESTTVRIVAVLGVATIMTIVALVTDWPLWLVSGYAWLLFCGWAKEKGRFGPEFWLAVFAPIVWAILFVIALIINIFVPPTGIFDIALILLAIYFVLPIPGMTWLSRSMGCRLRDETHPNEKAVFEFREPEMVLIPAGEFLMGSDPQYTLYLPDYYLGKTPVTQAQYAAFVQATGYRVPSVDASWARPDNWSGPTPPRGKENHPVVLVSWHDAVAYCNWLAEVTVKPYRLPSEAEWEKGARGTDGHIYPWGNRWDPKRCNTLEGGKRDTSPVGDYPEGVSPYGLLDMAGNVWEWTWSSRAEGLAQLFEVQRGGSWKGNWSSVRCASRNKVPPGARSNHVGFRVAASPGSP
jgi:formylglycine-generating enzyme required for sulfatase activity